MIKVYLAITNDIYELPVAVFDTTKQAARWLGVSRKHILSYISKQQVNKKYNIRFIKVIIKED
ncbi:MAG: hypothetical protein IJ301_04490 [Clostridia bacterium]|nr:hypothetical protein [Clostridia bacterium]